MYRQPVRDLGVTILVALAAFAGTMVDNLVALTAQLALSDARHHRRACVGQFTGVVCVIVIAAGAATAITPVPIRWTGVLVLAPLALAWHTWRHRHDRAKPIGRAFLAAFATTIAVAGDNLAVWIPLLRVLGVDRGLVAAALFIVADLGLIEVARTVATHPRVARLTQTVAPRANPFLYLALAALVAWQCRLF